MGEKKKVQFVIDRGYPHGPQNYLIKRILDLKMLKRYLI